MLRHAPLGKRQTPFCGACDGHETGVVGIREMPSRDVFHAEALSWLAAHPAHEGMSIVTSLPDVSEMPSRDLDTWRAWFRGAAEQVLRWLPADGVAVFFQSDIRVHGTWIDKGYMVQRAAEDVGAVLLWHKIVCRKPAGTITHGRATYSHMLCFAPSQRPPPRRPGPDVLGNAGFMPWSRAMGVGACRLALRYVRDETATRVVVDPFCGHGTALAVANDFGFDAVGVDLSARQCRAARKLVIAREGEVSSPS